MKIYQLLIITFLPSCNNCPIIPNNTESFQDVSLGVCLASGLPENEYIINIAPDAPGESFCFYHHLVPRAT